MSNEEKEILNNLKEYMQDSIDKGYHKFIYNDLGWDFKCIDCINAIDNVLNIEQLKDIEQQICNEELFSKEYVNKLRKEIEELKIQNKKLTDEYLVQRDLINPDFLKDFISKDKIKAKIEEYDDKEMTRNLVNRSAGKTFQQAVHYEVKKVLQSLF